MDSFLGMVRKYTDITELTAEVIHSFVEKNRGPEARKGTWHTDKKADHRNLLEFHRGR